MGQLSPKPSCYCPLVNTCRWKLSGSPRCPIFLVLLAFYTFYSHFKPLEKDHEVEGVQLTNVYLECEKTKKGTNEKIAAQDMMNKTTEFAKADVVIMSVFIPLATFTLSLYYLQLTKFFLGVAMPKEMY
jgi:hypothetical protein